MPRDMSSSSNEDEVNDPTAKSPVKRKESHKKSTRYQCPGDFVHFCHKPCSSTLTESLKNNKNELWLIKTPASFNPECFSGIKVPLSGLQNLRVPAAEGGAKTGSGQQIYSILASTHGTADLCLLTSDKQSSDGMVFGPTFSGLLNVCESYGDSSTNQASHIIPAAPAPSIPPGLKQRFHHASKPPTLTRVAESETDGAALGASSPTLCPLLGKRPIEETWQEEEGRKKKKKKKEKRIKAEREEESLEVVGVKVEPVAEIKDEIMTDLSLQEGDISGKKRKKKKKRDRDPEVVEEGMEPSVRVKEEKQN